jgi:hypothetical protein
MRFPGCPSPARANPQGWAPPGAWGPEVDQPGEDEKAKVHEIAAVGEVNAAQTGDRDQDAPFRGAIDKPFASRVEANGLSIVGFPASAQVQADAEAGLAP